MFGIVEWRVKLIGSKVREWIEDFVSGTVIAGLRANKRAAALVGEVETNSGL